MPTNHKFNQFPMAKKKATQQNGGNDWTTVRELTFSLPAIEESTSYGTPAIKVAGKLLARQHQDGENIVLAMKKDLRQKLIVEKPEFFHVTDHYLNYEYVLVRLHVISREDLAEALYNSWRSIAPKKIVSEYDQAS